MLALSAKFSAQDPPIKHYVVCRRLLISPLLPPHLLTGRVFLRLWTLQWVEQPEDIPTALAVVPNRLEQGVLALIKKSKCSSWK